MTVAGRREGQTVALTWDIDEVTACRRWDAIVPGELPPSALAERFVERDQGALVIWQTMDAIGGLHGLDKDAFFLRVQDIRSHLSMVFHRFLAGDARRLSIAVNGRTVRSWDPFLRTHPATITMQAERLRRAAAAVTVTPYVLPHRDRFQNDAEYEEAGGPAGWGERQGFYVYRGKRLVVAGGWLGLGGTRAWTREESSRLARIAVDLPLGVDAEWRIDVRKSLARPPGALRARLTEIGSACRDTAREVFAWRGGRARSQTGNANQDPLWIADSRNGRIQYRINRTHPAVIAVGGCARDMSALDALLALIERNVPVERIWLDVSEAEGAAAVRLDEEEIAELAAKIAALVGDLSGDEPASDRMDRLLRHLPVDSPALRKAVLQLVEGKS
jgi:hypothetical protein